MIPMQEDITPVVLTYNEAPNIARCLEKLGWAKRVVIIDSGSNDATAQIVAGFPNAELFVRAFDNHTAQWNYGVEQVTTPWVLSLDADYILTEAFNAELRDLRPPEAVDAYFGSFRYCIGGKPLRGSLYPPRALLFRKGRCTYIPDGHTQTLRISGPTGQLAAVINHDDRKPLTRWLSSQIKYAELEAAHLLSAPAAELSRIDKLRAMGWIMPFLAPVFCMVRKGLWRDGLAGWHYTMQRWLAECMIALAVIDLRLSGKSSS